MIRIKLAALVSVVALGLSSFQAYSASLGLTVPLGTHSDIRTSGTFIDYDYTGTGGTLTIEGITGTVSQSLLTPPHFVNGSNSYWVVDNTSYTDLFGFLGSRNTGYTLTANFDQFGGFLGGTVRVDGYVHGSTSAGGWVSLPEFASCTPACNSGVLYEGSLVDFGFVGGPTTDGDGDGNPDADALTLEWTVELTGGDFYNLGLRGGGVVATGDVYFNSALNDTFGDACTPQPMCGAWDPSEVNDTSAFTQDFSSCYVDGGGSVCASVQVDSFVPVPAAIWLFGSGLAGLAGFAGRGTRRGR